MNQRRLALGLLGVVIVVGALSGRAVVERMEATVERPPTPPDVLYAEVCGECHMAYPPELLPMRSWVWLFANPRDHFGVALELPEETRDILLRRMVAEAADASRTPLGRAIVASLRTATDMPLRMEEVPFLAEIHQQAGVRGPIGACDSCHPDAEKGSFDTRR